MDRSLTTLASDFTLITHQDDSIATEADFAGSFADSNPRPVVGEYHFTFTGFEDVGHFLNAIFRGRARDDGAQANNGKRQHGVPDAVAAENRDVATGANAILCRQRGGQGDRQGPEVDKRDELSCIRITKTTGLVSIELAVRCAVVEKPLPDRYVGGYRYVIKLSGLEKIAKNLHLE